MTPADVAGTIEPSVAGRSHKHEIETLRAHLSQTRYVGEIGLDYSTADEEIKLAQRKMLGTIADWVK
jgi:Tat protein secretion system quality control protein TatD with DNase activity